MKVLVLVRHEERSDLLARKASSLAKAEEWQELKPLLDTLLKLEPGNAKAWFNRALMLEATNGSEKERQKAWSEAVRLSSNTTRPNNDILNNYSKTIGAKFVNLLPISPKTMYPQFFGHKKNLFTLDPPQKGSSASMPTTAIRAGSGTSPR